MRRKKLPQDIYTSHIHSSPPMDRAGIVWLHDIRSAYNVGSVFRTVDAFGFGRIVLSGFTPKPPHQGLSKSALGAEETVTWDASEQPVEDLQELKRRGYLLVAVEQTYDSKPLDEFQPPHSKICIIGGGEVHGIDDDLLSVCDQVVEIPQFGHKHSLNVSVAMAVVMHHVSEAVKSIG